MTDRQRITLKAALMSAGIILGPLILVPSAFRAWQLWWLFIHVFLLIATQPDTKYSKLGSDSVQNAKDRGTIKLIIIAGYASVLLPELKFYWDVHSDGLRHTSHMQMAAAILGSAALFFRIWSIQILGKFFTSHVVIQSDHQLCQKGPYKFLRHPSYTGNMVFLSMVPVVMGYPLWVLLYIGGWFFVYRKRIAAEEAALGEAFGQTYKDYCSRTSALLPVIY